MLNEFIKPGLIRRVLLYALYMLIVLLLQEMMFSRIAVLGVKAYIVPAAVVAAGMFEGGMWGGVFGLIAGLFCDMSLGTTALFTVYLPVVGFLSGTLTRYFVNQRFFAYMCVALAALLIAGFLQCFELLVFKGQSAPVLLRTALLQGLWSIPAAVPLYFPCKAMGRRKEEDGQRTQ